VQIQLSPIRAVPRGKDYLDELKKLGVT
jgi:hypothetical protein